MEAPAASQELEYLAPARIQRLLACPLKIAFEQAQPPTRAPSGSPAAQLGLTAHRAIELFFADGSNSIEDAWQQACHEMSDQSVDVEALTGARRMRLRLHQRLPALVHFVEQQSPRQIILEEALACQDVALTGRPDMVLVGHAITVVDYKSGTVERDVGVNSAHAQQLAVYAWLAAHSLRSEDVHAVLFSLRRGILAVDVSPTTRDSIVRRALDARDAYNERVPGPQPATPSQDACNWCPHACPCPAAWEALQDGRVAMLRNGEAARGRLTDRGETLERGPVALTLTSEAGTATGPLTIIDVPADVADGLAVGTEAAFVGLGLRSKDPLVLQWRANSRSESAGTAG